MSDEAMTEQEPAWTEVACLVCGDTKVRFYGMNREFSCGAFYNPTLDNWSGNCSNAFSAATRLIAEVRRLQAERDAYRDRGLDHIKRLTDERDAARRLLQRLYEWDMMDVTDDGPSWRREIAAALA
jgi:hypothetical protein